MENILILPMGRLILESFNCLKLYNKYNRVIKNFSDSKACVFNYLPYASERHIFILNLNEIIIFPISPLP